jgi:hypothetical protein
MVLTDPQSVILELLDPMFAAHKIITDNLTRDDGVTLAKFEACMDHTENRMALLFTTTPVNLDLLIVVGKPRKRAYSGSGPAVGYEHVVTVTPVAVTKYNSSGAVVVTASRMVDKAAQEIRRVVNNNMSGSMKLSGRESKAATRIGSLLVWGEPIDVIYLQWTTAYGTYTTGTRRFGHYLSEWRVGVSSGAHTVVGASSGLGPYMIGTSNPVTLIDIPGGTAIPQTSGTFNETWWLRVRDIEAITVLLYETNIDGSANKAMSSTTRYKIGYMAFVQNHVAINDTSDLRSVASRTFTFTNAIVHYVERKCDEAGDYWTVYGSADSITETDA